MIKKKKNTLVRQGAILEFTKMPAWNQCFLSTKLRLYIPKFGGKEMSVDYVNTCRYD